ncbi:DUF6719 family protein [Rhodopseudomonas palustris]|uniref:Uncharacterized protein n=1 Tax=Rhodopseudomonas palustris (strain ATCC BAA-98 / CGA009) TaxID=258594 RepID=Q6N5E5_RHOPA|nr:DUF6719 family protein [Rhodopseudomonas palustris]ACF01944.1 hypothetical protein Rpal_3443 [Rhodopseudomonas palustris TIE-1]OPF93625.1 hypothetical protein B1S06_10565 [Rhodopseudomonas palustris]PPQ45263.1 hypothetical protein CKO39_00770 [Rhodopseudomonas palustris]QLH72074.1 hypothetical protein HZF03_15260 [Rhodopseudomonas palustris]QQM04567.1 hypothetical protein I8G32_03125 [Rhodopseudomonas palustris]
MFRSQPQRSPLTIIALGAVALLAVATPVAAQQLQVFREQDITELRLGQKILVDDGSCPNGQIKEVTGSTLSASGVVATVKCIQRVRR